VAGLANHFKALTSGFDPEYNIGPDYLDDMAASRAVFSLYQTYPKNIVEGAGQLVLGRDGAPGSFFAIFQPAQKVFTFNPIDAALQAGGVDHGTMAYQPLIDTSSGIGD